MLNQRYLLIIVFFAIGITKSHAGWYECYNYKGTIGNYPITLSIQITEDYFGEKDKKEFNINAVYKYDKYNNPIKLEAILKNNKIRLYENHEDQQTAVLEFDFSEPISTGYWTNSKNKKRLALNLKYISKLNDKTGNDVFEAVEILQLYALKDYYFMGVYSKGENEMRARMERIKIMNKKDDTLFQIMDFNDLDLSVGNIVTIIYQNITVNDFNNSQVYIWCDVGKMGGWFELKFDKQKNKFISDFELKIEGPN